MIEYKQKEYTGFLKKTGVKFKRLFKGKINGESRTAARDLRRPVRKPDPVPTNSKVDSKTNNDSFFGRIRESYEKDPKHFVTTGIAGTSLAIAGTNLAINAKRTSEAQEQNKELVRALREQNEMNRQQLRATKDLTSSLGGMSKSLDSYSHQMPQQPQTQQPEKKAWYRGLFSEGAIYRAKEYSDFREKIFFDKNQNNNGGNGYIRSKEDGILDSTVRGAIIGTGVGAISAGWAHRWGNEAAHWGPRRLLTWLGTSVAIGASLGLLIGLTRKVTEVQSRNASNYRITQETRKILESHGFHEGRDFTQDPKKADTFRSRVAVVVNRGNGDLKLVFNYINDPKLKNLAQEIVESLPRGSKSTETDSNKWNEVAVTTVSNGRDGKLIAEICEKFMTTGYKVYLIEVG